VLSVILQNNLHFDEQITAILKICSQRSPQNAERPRIVQEEYGLFFMLSFYVKFAMRCVHRVVTLLRLTRGKLMPSYRLCRMHRYGYVSAVYNIDGY